MVALSFPPKSSRLRLPLGRIQGFPLFTGSRLRSRVGALLTFVLLCIVLLFSLSRHDYRDVVRPFNKFHLDLPDDLASFQREYLSEHAALGKQKDAGRIYGNTLSNLVDVGDQPVPPTLKPLNALDTRPAYADTKASPYAYNPYPDYNSDAWKKENQGTYVPCHGPEHFEPSSVVFRGKSEAFTEPGMGSYKALGIDSTICFEREGWLGPYATKKKSIWGDEGLINWDNVNWKTLHDYCYFNNSDRYAGRSFKRDLSVESTGDAERAHSRDFPTVLPSNEELPERSEDAEEEAGTSGPNPERDAQPATRTAILLRAYSGIKFTENDKQSIRVLINELSLRSGAEYEVFFLMQIKNAPLTLDAAQKDLPREFWDMAVVWNDEQMAEYYPKLPPDANKVHVAQWLSVQKFANDRPDFDFYWNWELDTRLIGNHYEILQKLDEFSKKQPRKYLWERNERYYIPGVHGDYDTTFRKTVELAHGDDTVWGPVPLKGVDPSGPPPPVPSHREDNYEWGVGEDADYISLGPMFDPVDSSWVDLNSIWNFQTFLHTPRRATIGTQSRCSKRLLRAMHEETLKGNHIGSEMTPQSIALLHGFKAVYAPLPIFFDRAWSPESLNKFFNPGPLGESGSTLRTPYGWGLEQRFEGSTWYYRTTLPMKLYNSFLGWEDSGIGGERWERAHGRPCLPSMILHPIKDVKKTPHGFSTVSELPYYTD